MTRNESYRNFAESYSKIPIFSKPWWMDAVAPNSWDVFLYEENSQIISSFVYYRTNRNGQDIITKATLTQNNGPFIVYPPDLKYNKKISFENKILSYYIEELEKLPIDLYEQNFHYHYRNWLPFYWKNYQQTTRYTYVIKDTSDLERVRKEYHTSTRHSIKQAEKSVILVDQEEYGKNALVQLYETNRLTFDRQKKQMPYSYEFLKQLDTALKEHQSRKFYFAIDSNQHIHAIAYFVWDSQSVYYLIGGANPEYRSSQAQSLLVDKGIEIAHVQGKSFDFEGSMLEHVEPAFRKFGGVQMPYFRIYKKMKGFD